MSILVVGSIVLDFVAVADRLPRVNETVVTDDFTIAPGGKGANQALAANRFGSEVILISSILIFIRYILDEASTGKSYAF